MGPLLEAFGLDLKLFIAQLVNFGLLLALLTYFLYKPVMRTIDERRDLMAKGVADAEAAARAAAEADEKAKATLSAADTEAGSVVARARTEAAAEKTRLEQAAQARADAIIAEGEARARDAQERALRESEKEIARLALLAAAKTMRSNS